MEILTKTDWAATLKKIEVGASITVSAINEGKIRQAAYRLKKVGLIYEVKRIDENVVIERTE